MTSLIDPGDTWLVWSSLLALSALGLWSDSRWLGRWLSGAVVTLLAGIAASNLGIVPAKADAYTVVYDYLLPLAIPLVLFQADLRRILRESGRLLIGFLAGAAGTVTGAVLAFAMFAIGDQAAEITAALTAAYVGGTLNLVAVGKAVGLEVGDSLAAVVAAGNLTVILYLVPIFLLRNVTALARWLTHGKGVAVPVPPAQSASPLNPGPLVYAVTISAFVCAAGFAVQEWSGWPGSAILSITLLSVILATAFPQFFATLDCSSAVGFALLHVLFAAIGASASIAAVIEFGPVLVLFAATILVVHLLFVLLASRLFTLDLEEALVASNACALGAPTAAAMAVAFKRNDLVIPALLCGTFGYAVGNFVGLTIYGVIQ